MISVTMGSSAFSGGGGRNDVIAAAVAVVMRESVRGSSNKKGRTHPVSIFSTMKHHNNNEKLVYTGVSLYILRNILRKVCNGLESELECLHGALKSLVLLQGGAAQD